MICAAYRLSNGTPSPITQNFTDCNGNACSVTLPSGSTKYYITADLTTFVSNPAYITPPSIYNINRAFSFSSCCSNEVFHVLGDSTTLSPDVIGSSFCVGEITNASDCSINNTLPKGCYTFVRIDENIADGLGNQVYVEWEYSFKDCNDCITSWDSPKDKCVPCCRCYQIDVVSEASDEVEYFDCNGNPVTQIFYGLNNYVCSIEIPVTEFLTTTVTDLGTCSETEACRTCPETYCITNTGNDYDGTYTLDIDYDSHQTWKNGTYYIYYDTRNKQWCLSDSLGGPCLLSGKSPCYSKCPDLCEEYFFEGACPTTTTTTAACVTFDFEAIFDCLAEQTPTPTPTPTVTPTMTVTPSPTNYCSMVSVDATINTYSPTPTPTPTMTPTSSGIITRPCNVLGDVSFTTLEGHIGCPSSKQFQDCVTGMMYYTTELVPTPSGEPLTQFMIFKAYVDNVLKCISFVGINDNIIGVNTIELFEGPTGYSNLGECVLCDVVSSPTPTPTPTMTPTPSGIPCFCYELIGGRESVTFNYVDCNGATLTATSSDGIPTYICSLITPTTTSLRPYNITKLGICSNGMCPQITCNCYTVSNGGPKEISPEIIFTRFDGPRKAYSAIAIEQSNVYMSYYNCDNVQQFVVINDFTTTLPFCSLTTPFVTSSTNIITITLLGDCSSCFP
jgi:hypothetical protein